MTTQHPGSEIAGYRIEALIGRGGMAVVYRAEDMRLGRKVALKLLSPQLADNDQFRQRFIMESRLAASLDHPNIVPIYEAGEADGQLFIAMRYVLGSDLKALLTAEGGPLPDDRTLRLVGQIGDALDSAHRAGLVHRDVKPGNILVVGDQEHSSIARGDHVYLTDFGLTKRTTELSAGLTGTGHFLGTVDYVAPEQIQGKPVGPGTDIYALGCVLYECLTGRLPFHRDDDAALLWAHLSEMPPPITGIRPELSGAVSAVVARAMAKDPAHRYQSCRDLVRDLGLALDAAAPVSGHGAPGRPDDGATSRPSHLPSDGSLGEPGAVTGNVSGGNLHPPSASVRIPIPAEAPHETALPADLEPDLKEHAQHDRPRVVAASGRPASVSTKGPSLRGWHRGRRTSRLAVVAALALAVGAGVVGTNLLTSVGATTVVAEPALSTATDPFTPPPTTDDPATGSTSAPVSAPAGSGSAAPPGAEGGHPTAALGSAVSVSGDTAGLYGGTGGEACGVERMSTFLDAHPDRAAAWAQAEGIRPSDIRPFLRSLTPVVLRTDTAVTNHGYRNGSANAFPSVLQAGTAVLVDEHGVPRVRCACGNPLHGPTARPHVRYTGQTWPELQRRPVTVINEAPVIIQHFVVVVVQQNTTVVLDRPRGSAGDHDKPAPPQVVATALNFSVDNPTDAKPNNKNSPTDVPTADTGSGSPATKSSSDGSTSSVGTTTSGNNSAPAGSTSSTGSTSSADNSTSAGSTSSASASSSAGSSSSSDSTSSGGSNAPLPPPPPPPPVTEVVPPPPPPPPVTEVVPPPPPPVTQVAPPVTQVVPPPPPPPPVTQVVPPPPPPVTEIAPQAPSIGG